MQNACGQVKGSTASRSSRTSYMLYGNTMFSDSSEKIRFAAAGSSVSCSMRTLSAGSPMIHADSP